MHILALVAMCATKYFKINVTGSPLYLVDRVKSLGVYIDSNLSKDVQVNDVCRSCNYQIRAFRQMSPDLPADLVKTVSCCIVGPRLYYCNSLLYGISAKTYRNYRVQNNIARITFLAPRRSSAEPLLRSLQWLPVVQRIKYRTLLCEYKWFIT